MAINRSILSICSAKNYRHLKQVLPVVAAMRRSIHYVNSMSGVVPSIKQTTFFKLL